MDAVRSAALLALLLLNIIETAYTDPFLGINYGQVADNLPEPSATAKLIGTTAIEKVRLFGVDPAIIKAFANTGIGIVIATSNGDIPALASDPNFAKTWINTNVLPFYPATKIILINVGNEVMIFGDQALAANLLPAMQNIQNALNSVSLGGKIKVSTVHPMTLLAQSEPPSSGVFDAKYVDVLKGLLEFNNATGSPFAINPYPYFAYRSDTRPETLAFCLFQPNKGRFDSNTKINYMNMFDAQVDAVRSALNALGFKNVEIVVAETGWPSKGDGDEAGASVENAKAYNGGLIAHLRSKVGTPLMPGKSVDTYLFAMYDENLKPGPLSEKSFGLFKPDLTMAYDVGLAKAGRQSPKSPANSTKNAATWCVPKDGIPDDKLQSNLDFACGQGIDCKEIGPGGACFEPNTVTSHAAYAMNLFYQKSQKTPSSCDFAQTAILSSKNPSYGGCTYPGSS
ncbi:glucan endo-1,3-beta-glucosidase 7-like [Mangifera indica]|uniref:glucan endo-1,3-beta-glucosidase 7-like n=1 Tax=Mangifera indica TaxID=29780 RepID=UPI001CFBFE6D|nr:glucan endo-1,3-beta-glucosidase 7-like [Mangifera indica]